MIFISLHATSRMTFSMSTTESFPRYTVALNHFKVVVIIVTSFLQ